VDIFIFRERDQHLIEGALPRFRGDYQLVVTNNPIRVALQLRETILFGKFSLISKRSMAVADRT
jgi:hypothetical protein